MPASVTVNAKRDQVTHAVEEYCRYLGEALVAEDFDLIIERVA